ncbi:MAG: Rne/Rng family ribonuclease [Zoogloeaceae bacterium]|jgi:ribonuclease E|nr:Rne/Rng family ribonuclease [Zoogloeaceae bacterium]
MKRMLFNATQAEELRVAIVDGQKLIDLDIESAAKEQKKSNIYKGIITRIEPSLEAVFVDYGAERHGFLPFKEISKRYFQPGADNRSNIRNALRVGQEIVLQVGKDERHNKGAALTTFIALAGRYLVLMPNNPRGGGISRRAEGDERAELHAIQEQLEVPEGMSLIIRTAAISHQIEDLRWDLNYLLQLWRAIEGVAEKSSAPVLIYPEGSLVVRAIRDYFQPEIGEILIDTREIFEQAETFMASVMPHDVGRVKFYRDDVPLFSRFQIEHQIETAFGRQVNLPSGGAIVIDHTEALVAVDVNSGRATRAANIEETAFRTNLEAADEVARQLRLRDLGGLIVIDFIDMESAKNQREVENRLKDALKFDRARVQMGKISRFGLMELSRQRLRPALAETSYIPCPRCSGTGHIRSTESAALHILRILEEEAMKDGTAAVHAQVPVDVATFLLNEKRQDIQFIELRHKVSILLIPNVHLETPTHDILRLKHDDLNVEDLREPSYRMMEAPSEEKPGTSGGGKPEPARPRQEAALKNITPEIPAPVVRKAPPAEPAGGGIVARVLSWFRASANSTTPAAPANEQREGARSDNRRKPRDARRGEGAAGKPEKSERPPRGERNRSRETAAATPAANVTREPREPRKPRERREREPAAEKTAPAAEIAASGNADGNEESGNPRRRGNRRGRNSRRDAVTEESGLTQPRHLPDSADSDDAAASERQESAPRESLHAAGVASAPVALIAETTHEAGGPASEITVFPQPVSPSSLSTATAPAVVTSVAANVAVSDAVAFSDESGSPLVPPPAEVPSTPLVFMRAPENKGQRLEERQTEDRNIPVLPESPELAPTRPTPVDLENELAKSGLVLVQTLAAAPPETPAPATPKIRRPRRQKPNAAQPEEPLVLVETQGTESGHPGADTP